MELVRIKSYNHALITLLPLYCALIEGIMLALRTVNNKLVWLENDTTIVTSQNSLPKMAPQEIEPRAINNNFGSISP
jgi:hypothetical protein